ncbi:MAG: hypothetical protein FD180_596 [Planctomycetota bacterium]|nr:MAG: hypothetical protein FD180_596 [Planctomycetota bacterium]
MSSYGNLNSTESLGSEPDLVSGQLIACGKYIVPVGWMFAASSSDRIRGVSPEDEFEFFFYRVPKQMALVRLQTAVTTLKRDRYFWSVFHHLEGLVGEISDAPHSRLEIEFSELIAMGHEPFLEQAARAVDELPSFLASIIAGDRSAALKQLNSLEELCGMKLTGNSTTDEPAWKGDMKFLGIPTAEELCRWWVRGHFKSEF